MLHSVVIAPNKYAGYTQLNDCYHNHSSYLEIRSHWSELGLSPTGTDPVRNEPRAFSLTICGEKPTKLYMCR